MLQFAAISMLVLVVAAAVPIFGGRSFLEVLPLFIAAGAGGAIFRAVEDGNEDVGWFLPPILALAAVAYLNIRREQKGSAENKSVD